MPGIVLYVSGHGYGHATRMVALATALRRLAPELPLHVRTQAPRWLFTDEVSGLECSSAPIDVGMLQANGLDIDLAASLRAHEELGARWEELVVRETDFLRTLGPSLAVCDIPPLPFEAAARAGVPAFEATNFTWDWILEPLAAAEPRWRPVAERYAAAYAKARGLYRLPFAGDFRAPAEVVDIPLLARKSSLSKAEARRRLGLPDDGRSVVLVSFGGFGGGDFAFPPGEDLSGFSFVGFSPRPRGLEAEWRELPRHSSVRHVDLLAASDVLVGKPGYGTVSECVAQGTRFLYVPREDFREIPFLLELLRAWGVGRALPREDFQAGRWRDHLEALLAEPARTVEARSDGAEVLARHLLGRLA